MEEEFLYLDNGSVVVGEMAMQIPEFKDFKRYDLSTNKVFFNRAMSYIFYVYKVFGENRSYLHNMSLPQRKTEAVKYHTGTNKSVSDFEDNEWVKKCIASFLRFSRTSNEVMFDTLKEDMEMFINLVQQTPHTIKQKTTVYKKLDKDDKFETPVEIEIEIPNTESRIKFLKQASDLNDMFQKKLLDVQKDAKKKKSSGIRMFEDKDSIKNIPMNSFPTASK